MDARKNIELSASGDEASTPYESKLVMPSTLSLSDFQRSPNYFEALAKGYIYPQIIPFDHKPESDVVFDIGGCRGKYHDIALIKWEHAGYCRRCESGEAIESDEPEEVVESDECESMEVVETDECELMEVDEQDFKCESMNIDV